MHQTESDTKFFDSTLGVYIGLFGFSLFVPELGVLVLFAAVSLAACL
jgi:hypothetical protein